MTNVQQALAKSLIRNKHPENGHILKRSNTFTKENLRLSDKTNDKPIYTNTELNYRIIP